jgi:rubrerythrin
MEWSMLYPDAAKVAREEGFEEVAKQFDEIAKVESAHEKRYRKLLKRVQEGTVFKRSEVAKWHCRNCGYVFQGKEAPNTCPACAHPQAYYELQAENY